MDNFRSNKRNFVNRLSIFMLAVVSLLGLGLSVFGQTPSASPAPAISGVIGEVKNIDAAANQAVTQIAEQNDRRLAARDMGAGRDDQGPDDHFFDVTEDFLGSLLDMLGVERKPLGSDIHGFS